MTTPAADHHHLRRAARDDDGWLAILRAQWRELLRVWVRLVLFTLLQLFLGELAAASLVLRAYYPLIDGLAVTSCCWLLAGSAWVGWALLASLWRYGKGHLLLLTRDATEPPPPLWRDLCARLCPWEDLDALLRYRRATALMMDEEEPKPMMEDGDGGSDAVFPWGEWWSGVHACGLALFVVSYSVGGVFWLPQYALLLAGLWVLSREQRLHEYVPVGGGDARESRAFGLGLVGLVLAALAALAAHLWGERAAAGLASRNLWMGVCVPVGTVLVLRAGWCAPLRGMRSTLTLGLPSLMVLSVTYLSLYLPTQECGFFTRALGAAVAVGGAVVGGAEAGGGNDYYYYNNLSAAVGGGGSAVGAGLATLESRAPMVRLVVNATRMYYGFLLSAPAVGVGAMAPPSTMAGAIALLLGPTLLWLSMRALLRTTPSRAGGTAVAYVGALVLRRLVDAARVGAPGSIACALVAAGLFVPAAGLVLLPELRTLDARSCAAARSAAGGAEVPLYSRDIIAPVEEDSSATRSSTSAPLEAR